MITALILAGGQGLRMGAEDKGLVHWQGKPLIKHVMSAIDAQVNRIIISANRNLETYQSFGVPVFSDAPEYLHQGPLAGFMSLDTKLLKSSQWLLCVPCDTPLLPDNLVEKFQAALKEAPDTLAFYVETSAGIQPSCMFLSTKALTEFRTLFEQGTRSLRGCLNAIHAKPVWFELARDFTNCNSFTDINKLDSRILKKDLSNVGFL